MTWEVEESRNGSYTLKGNGLYVYSKYNPEQDVEKFITAETNFLMDSYFLIGLGLGYHIRVLLEKTNHQKIYVFPVNDTELNVFETYSNKELLNNERVLLVSLEQIPEILMMDNLQVIIPLQWVKALGNKHPLHDYLLDIKTRQMSYKSSNQLLKENFYNNIQNEDPTITEWQQYFAGQAACIVSAGPSLDETISLLQKIKDKVFIISVGSALKVLVSHSIIPNAVIITDPSIHVVRQIDQAKYVGPLFYLSTANHNMTQIHKYNRYIIFQEGYPDAENYADTLNASLLETGGSVATTALSLLEYMGFQNIFLFGQDLGFTKGRTHANGSTSGVSVSEKYNFQEVAANSDDMIYTTPNLLAFKKWFERKAKRTHMNIYNTSWNGANIKGAPFIVEEDVLRIVNLSDLN
ncbi:motility associated factor glycosyltransferase family protein [Sporosarcina beigongshangi]|uniref:motility associated factor glycosyltransferase family protein n=1 Tax=Sporosarcina beigongshangi TaxID=2782538 RepID=UPI00193A5518|nr:6-hydroxymethylpterin diphosphokinase MptE-like protein [Sporosarcina beigongshangi]